MENDFLAKSNGTNLSTHTRDLLKAAAVLRKNLRGVFQEEWWQALYYAAFLHDIGKIDPYFQYKINKKNQKFPITKKDIPHGFLSIFLFKPELLPFIEETKQIIFSAVAFHHWRDSFPDLLLGSGQEKVSNKAEEIKENSSKWEERVSSLRLHLLDVAQEYKLNPEIIDLNYMLIEDAFYNDLGSTGLLIPPYTMIFLPSRLRQEVVGSNRDEQEKKRIFIAGNLMRVDHFASWVEDSYPQINIEDVDNNWCADTESLSQAIKKGIGTDTLWQENFFQRRPDLHNETMLLIAPTGAGKTELAYIWGAGKKNIITLPLRAAVNNIYYRAKKTIKKVNGGKSEYVSLLYGDASIEIYNSYLKNNNANKFINSEYEGEISKNIQLSRQLATPYIICTADQIAPAVLRYPGYERIFAVLMNSCLVIDEVQAYDPRAAAIITHLIQQNEYFGGKTLLMTATLPEFIKNEVIKRTNLNSDYIINVLKEPEFKDMSNSSQHRINIGVHEGEYEMFIPNITKAACTGKKVLIVVNTIKAARKIYQKVEENKVLKEIPEIPIVLFHARFTDEDRKSKEERLFDLMPNSPKRKPGGCIVIATQVVEASLDLDADILFTDIAPADSLIQRMGRVFRRYSRSSGNNAPEKANVIIMVNIPKAKKKKEDTKKEKINYLATGIGAGKNSVYNLELTMLSLVCLLAYKNNSVIDFDNKQIINLLGDSVTQFSGWRECFFNKKPEKNLNYTKRMKALKNKILECFSDSDKSILLTEKNKINWVDSCYKILTDAYQNGSNFPIYLGNYLQTYYETLDTLDKGYCSEKKRDAEKLFRDVNSATVIPKQMEDQFCREIAQWIIKKAGQINYLDLANHILPRYLVNCPWYEVKNRDDSYIVDVNNIMNLLEENRNLNNIKIYDKLCRWLAGIYVVNINYSPKEGLLLND